MNILKLIIVTVVESVQLNYVVQLDYCSMVVQMGYVLQPET